MHTFLNIGSSSFEITFKKSTGEIEIDVQKQRDEESWKKLIDLTEGGKIRMNGKSSLCVSFVHSTSNFKH